MYYLYSVNHSTFTIMEKQYYVCSLPLKNFPPYVEIIKKYFGLSHPNLELEMLLVPDDPERKFEMTEYVPHEDIVELFEGHFPNVGEDKTFFEDLLWLVANLYYGNSYEQYNEFFENEVGREDNIWHCVEKDMARLYAFLQDHPKEEEIVIQMGKDKVVLDDAFNWFQGVMNNQVFPNCIPHIQDKESVRSLLQKKAGRPQTRQEVNAVVNGISRLFADEEIIEGKAPRVLLEFIHMFLVKMALIDENDVYVTPEWIKAQISNLQKPGKDARFNNVEVRSVSIEELKEVPLGDKSMRWIFPIK